MLSNYPTLLTRQFWSTLSQSLAFYVSFPSNVITKLKAKGSKKTMALLELKYGKLPNSASVFSNWIIPMMPEIFYFSVLLMINTHIILILCVLPQRCWWSQQVAEIDQPPLQDCRGKTINWHLQNNEYFMDIATEQHYR